MEDTSRFNENLQKIIDEVNQTLIKLNQNTIVNPEILLNSSTFSVTDEEKDALILVTGQIEGILQDTFASVDNKCQKYLLNLLHEFHYDWDEKQFKPSLSINDLHSFLNELQALQASLSAFQAAWDGQIPAVKQFIEQYPQMKDKPGIFGTTMLYSAARNNKLDLVKYLIEVARCFINVQNQQHVGKVLLNEISTTDDFDPAPTAGSTALHGACFYDCLDVVKYLVEHGADYFLTNHATETPIHNCKGNQQIEQFFREYLILGYSNKTDELPERPILEGQPNSVDDCMWEYKPFADVQWFQFSSGEASELSQVFRLQPNKQFQEEIHLAVRRGVYSVSTVKFLRSGKNRDPKQNLAWIRCRGSSIENFNCYALWQIMFIKHPSIDSTCLSSLDCFSIPLIIDSSFKLQANVWYHCSEQINSKFNQTINYRQKILSMKLPFINESLKFNFLKFQFSNTNETIIGFIRWIPKLISANALDNNKIVLVDNFKSTTDLNPIPMTYNHQKFSDKHKNNEDNDDGDNGNDESEGDLIPIANEIVHSNNNVWSMKDLTDSTEQIVYNKSEPEARLEDCVNEQNAIEDPVDLPKETPVPDESNIKLREATSKIKTLEEENVALAAQIQALVIEEDNKNQDHQRELAAAFKRMTRIENESKQLKQEQDKLRQIKSDIQTINYDNIKSQLVEQILIPNSYSIINILKKSSTKQLEHVPRIDNIHKQNMSSYRITFSGFQEHHTGFRRLYLAIQTLCKSIESAKEFYQRELNRYHRNLMSTCFQVSSKTHFWISYSKLYSNNIREKIKEYIDRFNQFLSEKTNDLVMKTIEGTITQPWIEIRRLTDQFLKDEYFFNEINSIKHRTLELFIQQNISYQRIKSDKKPTIKSASVAQQMIEKLVDKFRHEPQYQGYELKQMQMIPSILQQINIYYSCFSLQLPLFESAIDLLDKIQSNTVTLITTSTGSGKSSLTPALLLAEGYDKIIVTQPRRLPCQMISQRVNETMSMNTNNQREDIAGWIVSGAEYNPDARILFMTDGLLKERLLYDKQMFASINSLKKGLVIFLDEVHERSVNIDLCLAFLARLLTEQPGLKTKLRIIISSATLNESVPNLFKKLPNINVAEFALPQIGTPYPVTKHIRENANILDIVQELYRTCQRNDQILCFVNSALDATQYCKLLSDITKGSINARVLIQSQSPRVQYKNIEEASVLFSTTIAETSLTFPSLRYVIDTGYINLPIYDSKLKRTVLTTLPAANSTIKQRQGRVGRTKAGDYYALYDSKIARDSYPKPQITATDLTNYEFSLRRSPLKCGFNVLQEYLPDKPSQDSIQSTVSSLRTMGILEAVPNENLTKLGIALSKIPDFGSLSMSLSVLSALQDYNCGYDLMCLSSILGVLNTTAVLNSVPAQYKSTEGDFMTLFKLMDEILSIKQSIPSNQFNLEQVCRVKGLLDIKHVLGPAIRRYISLEKSFNLSNDYRQKAHMKSNNWENIAKALLTGFHNNVFISSRELQEKNHLYMRSKDSTDIAMLDLKSTLLRSLKQEPVPIVLVRDVLYSSAVRKRAILSFAGEIKLEWMQYQLERTVDIITEEETYLNTQNRYTTVRSIYSDRIHMNLTNNTVTLRGQSGVVINAERHIRRQMINILKFELKNSHPIGSSSHENLSRNLAKISKMPKIFHPMIWRWKLEKQVEITFTPTTSKTLEVSIKGRDSEISKVKKEIDSFMSWLGSCAVMRDPDAGVQPRIIRQPMRSECKDIEDRISHITDSKRTRVDLHNGVKGRDAKRETRMEVVAWIAVCKFNCKVEGGFVRDWIVGEDVKRPLTLINQPKQWIQYQGYDQIPYMHKEVVPSDLDCHLPQETNFDIEKFQDELHKYDIKCKVYRQTWRYVLLIDEDESTGPFTMDLIEPHVALTHDRIDFDVSNLYLAKDYTREIGMRVDIQQKPYSIELESIIDNIKKKRFRILRSNDHTIQERIEKMTTTRGWTQFGEVFPYLPSPDPQYLSVLVPLLSSSVLYKDILTQITAIAANITIKSIEQIKNPLLEDAYEAMKKIIARQCPGSNPNERELFHGTKGEAIQGITDHGFDDRYFSASGRWGHGAYFADNPKKSHGYTRADPTDQTHVIFYAKVLLGNSSVQTTDNSKLVSAPVDHHSVQGSGGTYEEYIVYRYGQALPYLKITYK